ncbi:MAG: hypothetical protein ACPLW8_02490 [Candidatus Bathyarchaeales archaeon]
MYKKKCSCTAFSILCIILVTATVAALLASNAGIAKAEVADSMWIEPSTLNFNAYEVNVGYKFNVTVWLNVTSQDMFSWQFKLFYNTEHLQATRAGYTGPNGASSEWATHRTGGAVSTVSPDIEADYVMFTESCQGDNYVPKPVCASLAWVEFNITALPPSGGEFESLLDINNTRTWVLNYNLDEITITKSGAEYHLSYSDTVPPSIGEPTQDPATNVQPGQTVKVSVNVTDAESGVKNVTLYYTNDTAWYNVSMQLNSGTGLWEANIPGHDAGTTVKYKIEAYDNAGNKAVKDNAGAYYIYTVIPEFTLVAYIVTLMITSTVIVVTLRKKLKT